MRFHALQAIDLAARSGLGAMYRGEYYLHRVRALQAAGDTDRAAQLLKAGIVNQVLDAPPLSEIEYLMPVR